MIDRNTLISMANPKSQISEAYRILRTNIQFTGLDRQLKTIMVTSSGPGEGKTTTTVNLAVVFAQSGNRVLLIDADLRKPRVYTYFDIDPKKGITTLLSRQGSFKDYVQKSGVEGLDVIACGPIPPNPSELIGSNAMKKFIEEIKGHYDTILFDSPPVNPVTDAAVLSTLCDGVIFVCRVGQTKVDSIQKSKEHLVNVNANILGVVLNGVDKNIMGTYSYRNYYDEKHEGEKRKKKSFFRRKEIAG
ncbi:MAG: CpsD/CapB family tyrosine-protein kinase [Clostridia bacterium]|nr:CpsD/CapB family tyrosine-protein kinase [Clostridia bacterium]